MGAVVQARTTSTRCPGKVLRVVAGRPLLAWTVERLRLASVDAIVTATSVEAADDPIEDLCRDLGVGCHRGSLDDVARRLVEAGRADDFHAIVRVSGDSPVLLPSIVSAAVERYRAIDVDLVTNVSPRTFPKGQSVEVVRLEVLEAALPRMTQPHHREHVTAWLYEHPEEVRIDNLRHDVDLSGVSMVVDTEDDFLRMRAALAALGHPGAGLDLDELLALLGPTSSDRR